MNKKHLATMIMAAGLLATACGDDDDDNDIDTPIETVIDDGSVTTMGTDTSMVVETTVAP